MIKFLGSLVANLATLVTALALGIAIWAAAVRAGDPVVSLRFNPPVETMGQPPQSQLLDRGHDRVQILVEGRESILDELGQDDFRVFIDLSEVPYGESEVEIQIRHDQPQVNVIDMWPETTIVRLEQIVTREIPVRPDLRGDVARGHIRGDSIVDPVTLQVTGPASRVEQLAEARITVFLNNERQDVVVARRPTFYDLQGNVTGISGLNLSNDEVLVIVPVIELVGFAEKPVTPQWRGSPAPGYRLLNVTVQPPSMLVTGLPAALDKLRVLRTEPIDITGLVTSFTQQVPLELPGGISLDEPQPIIVTVEIEPILTSSIIAKEPDVRALGPNLIAELDPGEVRIFLFGPLPVLDSLQQDDVRVTLDLLNLDIGVHNVIPIVDVFANDVDVRSFQPPFVTVVITREITLTEQITGTGRLPSLLPQSLADTGVAGGNVSGDSYSGGTLHLALVAPELRLCLGKPTRRGWRV
jgi:YbbR domain-containing protein